MIKVNTVLCEHLSVTIMLECSKVIHLITFMYFEPCSDITQQYPYVYNNYNKYMYSVAIPTTLFFEFNYMSSKIFQWDSLTIHKTNKIK